MLELAVHQHIVGTKNVDIYPFIRKIDLMSSNSYIISGSDQIALIDPGGLADQVTLLDREVARLQEEQWRPLMVYLTHVHLDHWIQLMQTCDCKALRGAALAVQETGAKGLESGDSNITLAKLLERQMAQTPVKIKLLTALDKITATDKNIDINGYSLDYSIRSMNVDELELYCQAVHIGKDDQMEIYHIPGHSPDSICMLIGSILIIGDLFFAPNPGMAGANGWSKQDLMESIRKVLWLLENKNIVCCCSGHGRPIDSDTAKKTLKVMYRDAAALDGLEEISPEWAKRTSAYALDIIGELERIFTIIAGRLAFIAHMLGELEEKDEAEKLVSLISSEKIDDLFSDLNSFASQLRAGKKLDLEMVHKTGQTVGRLDALFEKEKLGSVIDKSLMSRAGRLLCDYSMIYRGFRPTYYVDYVDVPKLVGTILEKIEHDANGDTAILDALSEEDYLKALKSRIAQLNLFENVHLLLEQNPSSIFANMDKDRFSDAFIDILERFAAGGAGQIKVKTVQNDDWISVRIVGDGRESANLAAGRSQRFLERNLSLCGGLMQAFSEGNSTVVEIEFFSQSED